MIFQIVISFIAKTIYRKEYTLLKTKLLAKYAEITIVKQDTNISILEKLLISGEDHRFRYHFGFDVLAIIRACKSRFVSNKLEGASTIEQQLVRVLIYDFKKTASRKIKEIFLATTLQELVPRNRIPLIYLNVAYYGPNLLGYREVFKRLNIDEDKTLTEDVAAEIIARIKYPETPTENERRNQQIKLRKMHLLSLHDKHKKRKYITIY